MYLLEYCCRLTTSFNNLVLKESFVIELVVKVVLLGGGRIVKWSLVGIFVSLGVSSPSFLLLWNSKVSVVAFPCILNIN